MSHSLISEDHERTEKMRDFFFMTLQFLCVEVREAVQTNYQMLFGPHLLLLLLSLPLYLQDKKYIPRPRSPNAASNSGSVTDSTYS